jgi:hypothetical protein
LRSLQRWCSVTSSRLAPLPQRQWWMAAVLSDKLDAAS